MGNLRNMLLAVFVSATVFQISSVYGTLSDNTGLYFGQDCAQYTGLDSVDLKLLETGGSGFSSYNSFLYGSFSMLIKLPAGNSAGTVTTFYLSSEGDNHDEIDFEFLGNTSGSPYTIHTNVFTQGKGNREVQFKAWFDPTDGFHKYTIFWNLYAIVWYVNDVPIRVFRKQFNSNVNYPDSQPMKVYASLWNADDWATQGGRVKTDWSLSPFVAQFQGYNPEACVCDQYNFATCTSPNFWYNDASKYYQLSETAYYQMLFRQQQDRIFNYCDAALSAGVEVPEECWLTQN